ELPLRQVDPKGRRSRDPIYGVRVVKRNIREGIIMPRILGLTGNIASGKTAVGHMLLELGAERYIDADAVVHHLYEAGQPIAVQLAELFGPGVIAGDGTVDRIAQGAPVFQDAEAVRRLEAIVHPAGGVALAHGP